MNWRVYILYSESHQRTYVGVTSDLEKRISYHNGKKVPSTRNYTPWRVVYTESFSDETTARKREKYYKSGVGRRQMRLIFDTLGLNK